MSWFSNRPAQPHPMAESKPAPTPVATITANPPTLNPTQDEERSYAEWRIGHIERWLAHPMNADADPAKRAHLEAERDMYSAMLRMKR